MQNQQKDILHQKNVVAGKNLPYDGTNALQWTSDEILPHFLVPSVRQKLDILEGDQANHFRPKFLLF